MEAVTKDGKKYSIDDALLDDFEFFEELCEVDNGNLGKIPNIAKRLLGSEQYEELKNDLRNKKGQVSTKKMFNTIFELVTSVKVGKN